MRLRACLGGLLAISLGACETIPETIRLELHDRSIVVDRKPVSVEATGDKPAVPDEAGDDEPR